MTTQRVCDCCGKSGAKQTSVQLLVVEDISDHPVQTEAVQDLCDDCRDGECDKMLSAVKADHKVRLTEVHVKGTMPKPGEAIGG